MIRDFLNEYVLRFANLYITVCRSGKTNRFIGWGLVSRKGFYE